ncbi:LacI family DNA-binding transcriptional regulator [Bifidobacterium sp. ESL0790]|uniref:LacI family DNA-binding transcriptional regulator n=1 Tax=Bifidobacterium sp. ESL0790 TaxID=2983233 RepID=UPI0023F7F546|nr:LacI family DNA-binding transcriptional regulator [Bifidobacterium sp. ESL0790]WEV72211.1 LacI family DNA-binding transcriptional regulator [Bifidobacterium sp. ESL0790]
MGGKKMTIRDIASRSGVSRATVSRYLNGGHWVSDEAAAKIRKVIDQTGYVANKNARSLATGHSDSVAFLLGEPQELLFDDPNFSTLLRSIADELGRKGMSLIMMTTDNDAENERNLKFLRGGPVDGVLLVAWHRGVHKGLLKSLREMRMPVVVAEYPPIDAKAVSYVHVDDYQGAAQATRYLAERGARRIGMLAGPEGPSGTRARIRGFEDMLEQLDLEPEGIEHGGYNKASGYEATLRLLGQAGRVDDAGGAESAENADNTENADIADGAGRVDNAGDIGLTDNADNVDNAGNANQTGGADNTGDIKRAGNAAKVEQTDNAAKAESPIDGLFAASDLMAAGALQALRQQGLAVPGDVQVVGFDDQAVARICEPPLTTIRQPFDGIGKHMVDQLIDLMNGGAPSGTTLPLELVVRESTK